MGPGSCSTSSAAVPYGAASLPQALERNPELSTLVSALGAAGWLEMLDDPALTYTVFAPTSEPLHTWLVVTVVFWIMPSYVSCCASPADQRAAARVVCLPGSPGCPQRPVVPISHEDVSFWSGLSRPADAAYELASTTSHTQDLGA